MNHDAMPTTMKMPMPGMGHSMPGMMHNGSMSMMKVKICDLFDYVFFVHRNLFVLPDVVSCRFERLPLVQALVNHHLIR